MSKSAVHSSTSSFLPICYFFHFSIVLRFVSISGLPFGSSAGMV